MRSRNSDLACLRSIRSAPSSLRKSGRLKSPLLPKSESRGAPAILNLTDRALLARLARSAGSETRFATLPFCSPMATASLMDEMRGGSVVSINLSVVSRSKTLVSSASGKAITAASQQASCASEEEEVEMLRTLAKLDHVTVLASSANDPFTGEKRSITASSNFSLPSEAAAYRRRFRTASVLRWTETLDPNSPLVTARAAKAHCDAEARR